MMFAREVSNSLPTTQNNCATSKALRLPSQIHCENADNPIRLG